MDNSVYEGRLLAQRALLDHLLTELPESRDLVTQWAKDAINTTPSEWRKNGYSDKRIEGLQSEAELFLAFTSRFIHTKVSGVTFANESAPYDRQEIIALYVHEDAPVELEPEPDNAHDTNAIKVLIDSEEEEGWLQIGFLPKQIAAKLIDHLLEGNVKSVEVAEVTGGGELTYGVNLTIVLDLHAVI